MSRYHAGKTASVIKILALLFCSSLLAGCATLPIMQTSTAPWKDLYRRIPYKIEGNYRVIDIFYATDRVEKTDAGPSIAFTNKLSPDTTHGKLNVKINPYIKIDKMLPERLKRNKDIGIQEVSKLDEDAFVKQVSDAVAASPHNSLLVMVFGYKDDFEATAIKAAYFSYLLDVNTPVLLFDWPGDQSVTPWGYKDAQGLAIESGPRLGELLTTIIRKVGPKNLWIEASSLGSQVVCDAFDYMYQHADLADADQEIAHVILAAPDVGRDEFKTNFKDKLVALSKKLTTYVSSDDNALLMSGFLNRGPRLGRISFTEPEQLEETKELLYVQSLLPDQVAVIDVTPVNNSSFKHGYYLESPDFYDDFYTRIMGKEPNVSRRLYLIKCKDNVDFWVMRGDK